jgi:hypothetical protein
MHRWVAFRSVKEFGRGAVFINLITSVSRYTYK